MAVEDGRDQSEVAAAHQVSWPTVQRAVVARGSVELVEPEPTTVLGMDETRFGRPRWLPDGERPDGRVQWRRTDPWETGFVDITGDQSLLGQVDGRTSAAVHAWLAARTEEFRARIEVVVIDPHAGYAAAVRAALPDATSQRPGRDYIGRPELGGFALRHHQAHGGHPVPPNRQDQMLRPAEPKGVWTIVRDAQRASGRSLSALLLAAP